MLDFSSTQNMLDYYKHTLEGMIFDFFQPWKTQEPEEHRSKSKYKF